MHDNMQVMIAMGYESGSFYCISSYHSDLEGTSRVLLGVKLGSKIISEWLWSIFKLSSPFPIGGHGAALYPECFS